ncbi:unnamed protein product [Cuscuta campestris]|uniref:Helitron helicase-like domain-containing protein n=1 Tax=Cuscuta campestris TaxID=132261 RepID=A0A484MKQ4_9ASTE|nr:unnamed protein product [Cuscuta campestris]
MTTGGQTTLPTQRMAAPPRRKQPQAQQCALHANSPGQKLDYLYLGFPHENCQYCHAIMWTDERNNSKAKNSPPTFSLCCMEGRVSLSALKSAPQYLRDLLSHNGGKRSATFRENIRAYNSILAFTSIGAQIDYEINKTKGPYVFRISGQNCHQIGSLNPQPGKPRKFLQLYMYDNKTEEVCSRIKSLTKDKPNSKLDESILSDLITMLDRENCLAKTFRMARDRMKVSEDVQFQLHLLSERTPK